MDKRKLNIDAESKSEVQTQTKPRSDSQTQNKTKTTKKSQHQTHVHTPPFLGDPYSNQLLTYECSSCNNSIVIQRGMITGSADFKCASCGGFMHSVSEKDDDIGVLTGSIFD